MTDIDEFEHLLPSKPVPPQPSDCCSSGCVPCVHDIYETDLKVWKKKCDEVRSKTDRNNIEENILNSHKYSSFKLIKINKISPHTFIFTFELPPNCSLGLKVGQHIIVRGFINNYYISRPYTPISDLNAKGNFELLIKIYEKGKMSSVVTEWKEGDFVEMRGPYGSFSYIKNSFKRILMLAAGTGIAPMFQVIKFILNDEEEYTKLHLMYSSKNFDSILLREELYALQSYWNFTACYFLSQETSNTKKKYKEEVKLRRITKRDVEIELLNSFPESTYVLVCGTKSFDKDMLNAALNVDQISEENVFRF